MRSGVVFLALTAVVGCKASRWRDRADKGSETAASPQLAADATVSPPGPGFDVDERTGRPKVDLILRLDSFPAARPGGTNLPVCFDAFAAIEALGFVMCDGKPDTKLPLTAGMLTQECYTHPDVAKVPASQTLTLNGCKRGMILANGYTPTLRIDAETRDIAAGSTAPTALP